MKKPTDTPTNIGSRYRGGWIMATCGSTPVYSSAATPATSSGAKLTYTKPRWWGSSSEAIVMWNRKKMVAGLSTPPEREISAAMVIQSRAIWTRAKRS